MAQEFIPPEDFHPTMNFFAVHSDGTDLESDSSIWDNMWKILNAIKTSEEAKNHAFEPTRISVYDFISKNWAKLFLGIRGESEKAVVKSVIEWQSYYATNWERTSIGSMAVDTEFEGDQLLIKNGGYTRILNRYLDHHGLRSVIRFESAVTKIDRSSSGPVLVTVAGNELIEADVVVVTVPLGVLKKGSIEFVPPLPKYKRTSIKKLGFGVYDKIFVTFSKPVEFENGGFWTPDADVISVVPKHNDDYYEFLIHALPHVAANNPECTGHTRYPYDKRDLEHIGIEMANISAVANDHKIVMLIYGRAAKNMEKFANNEAALIDFVYQKLRNAFPDCDIPEITHARATAWGQDPYAYGSFANIPLGASGQDMINLSLPVDDQILFAGEATFPLHYSTVHGALKSGRREFARLMKMFYPDEHNEFEALLDYNHEN